MKIILLVMFLFILISCDGGLSPGGVPKRSYISGKITYIGGRSGWPSADSVKAIRIGAFKTYPPTNIINDVLNGNAYFDLISLPLFVDSSNYVLEITQAPVELKYVVLALQFTDSLQNEMAVGVYTQSGDNTKPTSFYVIQGDSMLNININVDFKHLPPQPFK